MNKRRKIDFVLEEDDFEKVVFRFYPRQSSCCGLKWEEVSEWYYHYKVIKYYKDDDGNIEAYYILFDSECDEDSVIFEISDILKCFSEGKSETKLYSGWGGEFSLKISDDEEFRTGEGSVDWRLTKCKYDTYRFELFRFDDDVGYRFWLQKEKAYEFGAYLNYCCEYMLEHGDPI